MPIPKASPIEWLTLRPRCQTAQPISTLVPHLAATSTRRDSLRVNHLRRDTCYNYTVSCRLHAWRTFYRSWFSIRAAGAIGSPTRTRGSTSGRHSMSGVQILALLGGLVGLGATIGATVSNEWRVTSRASSVITATWVLQGLWNNCAGNALGALHCRPHHTLLKLDGRSTGVRLGGQDVGLLGTDWEDRM